jgi:hypothetical protein
MRQTKVQRRFCLRERQVETRPSFNKAEKSYSTVEKELATVVWGIKYFMPYLYGRKFKVVSDQKPLTLIKDSGSKLLTWRLRLL